MGQRDYLDYLQESHLSDGDEPWGDRLARKDPGLRRPHSVALFYF
jgi:hypothetical protein